MLTTLKLKLYLAKPVRFMQYFEKHVPKVFQLAYTRGSVIPCFLTLTSEDAEALQHLSMPETPVVKLLRCLQHYFVPEYQDSSNYEECLAFPNSHSGAPLGYFNPGAASLGKNTDLKVLKHDVATAVWWLPSKEIEQQAHIRHLEGEIHLSSDLQPSCGCAIFSIEVRLADFE